MISCDDANAGCNGGNTVRAMNYIIENAFGGLASDIDYGFSDGDGDTTEMCYLMDKNLTVSAEDPRIVVDYGDDIDYEERVSRMKQAVSYVPIAVTLKSNCGLFSSYDGGIFTNDGACACSNVNCIDHAVLLVGFNDENDPKYWILKNSWDVDWGDKGYFYISQEPKGEWGLFGIMGHGIGAVEAFNETGAKQESAHDGLETWATVLIAVLGGLTLLW